MTDGARLGTAVTFVQQLDRSVQFYTDVLGLQVTDRSATAALLASSGGAQLVLRAMGATGTHGLGTVGVQYVIWTAASADALSQAQKQLERHSSYAGTRSSGEVTVLAGRDPDGVMVMIAHPGPDQEPLSDLPAWIYAW
jgi:catechol 2,3-dioxygenase-like lactoylglutathione lyase family enzyme